MNTTTTPKASNDIRYKTSKVIGKETIYVKIELNDDCKNGHQDFSITGDIYETGKPKTDRYFISGGCMHDEILKAYPEFKQFIDLHLCDYKGIPMHASANGFYHLTNGFNRTKPNDSKFKSEYCEYYRITENQFDQLTTAENELQFALMLQSLGILTQWEIQAAAAIKKLEELTGTKFIVDSKRTQYHAPTPEKIAEEEERQRSGYYTPEAAAKREQEKANELLKKLEAERDKDILKANTEFEVKKQVLIAGGKKALDNIIFYNHSNTLAFNWRSYDNLSDEVIAEIVSKLQLPDGVNIETKGK
jgi:hypothetical protein